MEQSPLHDAAMKEFLVYGISTLASLFIFGYCVHIFVGGLVSEKVEIGLIVAVVLISGAVIVWLLRDSLRHRQ